MSHTVALRALQNLRRILPALALACLIPNARADNYALIIGIDQYQQSQRINALEGATNDARALASTLEQVAGFPAKNVHVLVSGGQTEPTGANITSQLGLLAGQIKPGDTLFFLYSGHGIDLDGTSYLVPWDADARTEDSLRATVLPTSTLREQLSKIPAKTLLMAFDMCRSDPRKGARDLGANNLLGPNQARDLRIIPSGSSQRSVGPSDVITLFACSEGERSWEWTDKGRGYFSYYLEQGLRHDAADNNGVVHASNLIAYVQKAVYGAVEKQEGEAQTPFPLVEGKDAANVVLATGLLPSLGGATAVLKTDPTAQGRYDAALQSGYELGQQQRWPDAQTKFQTALSLQPASAKAADGLGRAYLAQNDTTQAETAFRQAVQSDSTSAPFITDLADTLAARNDTADAAPLYRQAMTLDPNAEAPVLSLAALDHKSNNNGEADTLLHRAMQINPKDPHPWDKLGDLHYDNKDYATAEGNYRHAVSLDTFGGQYLSHLARCLAKEGKMTEARSIADQARGLGVTVPDTILNTIDNLKSKIHLPSIGGFHF